MPQSSTVLTHAPGRGVRSLLFTLLIVIGVMGVSACTAPTVQPPAENDSAAATAEPAAEAASDEDSAAASSSDQETYKGLPVGFTEEGFPYRGDPDAPITLYEYSDYECPFCQRHFVQTEPIFDETYVATGQVRVVFRDFPLEQLHPNAPAAHVASLCVADQGAALYWEMHARLFETQEEWAQDPDAPAFFAGLAEEIGADMALYDACIESGEKGSLVAQGVAEARTLGFSGTPSFQLVDEAAGVGYELVGAQPFARFAEYVDAIAAGEEPPADEAEQAEAQVPYWATEEGLSPDPDRPGYTMAGDQYRGDPEAGITVVEFSDLQCPFCKRHTETTQPALDEQFVDTGQIYWIFKHFPLNIHPQAPAAGVAAECAAEQDALWEMHETLFAYMSNWSVPDPNPVFIDLAAELNLDTESFAACLDDPAMLERVENDAADGAPFVQGTPTFIVLFNGEGRIIPGALPTERFTEVLQSIVDATNESS